jgi:hypothetical protein
MYPAFPPKPREYIGDYYVLILTVQCNMVKFFNDDLIGNSVYPFPYIPRTMCHLLELRSTLAAMATGYCTEICNCEQPTTSPGT